MAQLEWLSPKLVLPVGASDDNCLDVIYLEFKKLYNCKLAIDGTRVSISETGEPKRSSERYKHFVKREGKIPGIRNFDVERAVRIWWIRDTTINFNDQRIMIWKAEKNGIERLYALLRDDRYLLILEECPYYYYVVTAYYIHSIERLSSYLAEYRQYKRNVTSNVP